MLARYWRDLIIAGGLAVLAAFASFQGMERFDPVSLDLTWAWFEADTPRVFDNMTRRHSDHYRAKVHPLFPLATLPAVGFLWKVLGIDQLSAVRLVILVVVAFWMISLFMLLRLLGCHRLDATLFSLLGLVSATSVFWFTVPEIYSFGSLAILLALLVVAISQYRHVGEGWYVFASAVSLSMTVTNWMVGIAAAFTSLSWRRAAQVTVNAFFLVTILWVFQKYFVPSAQFLDFREEPSYVLIEQAGGAGHILTAFVSHSMVMPPIGLTHYEYYESPFFPSLTVQHSLPWSGGLLSAAAAGLWIVLLGLGSWGFFTCGIQRRLRWVIGLTLFGQLGLHLLYGQETFLYSLHFMPLLLLVAACSVLTQARWIVLGLGALLLITAGTNNWLRFNEALALLSLVEKPPLEKNHTPRADVKSQMLLRPSDPWPRGQGHVVLAIPGSREMDKAYHEPGGSFSPGVGSFGVSLWVRDADGTLKATSDTISTDLVKQALSREPPAGCPETPSIFTETPFYMARWSCQDPSRWVLNLERPEGTFTELSVVIRSIGPAGGPIHALDWDGARLMINNRWTVTIDPAPAVVYLGEETSPGWMTARTDVRQWRGEDGWGYARIELGPGRRWQLPVEDSAPSITSFTHSIMHSSLKLSLPDKRFEDALNAQIAHLMVSLVGGQTRCCDPVNTPIPWQRDGAYIITALARAGQIDVARDLSRYLAENDFYGGFGAEADAPGLAIWALRELASLLDNPEYDKWLWPHVARKATLIEEMLTMDRPMFRTSATPVVPDACRRTDNTLVADPAREGLIIGRMDHQWPLLYVNAVSYRGLLDAAWLADRLGHREEALRWRKQAQTLKEAWIKGFKPPESENDRTYISALWPTQVAKDNREGLQRELKARWHSRHDSQGGFYQAPLWTYFEIAEAHQWLYLNQLERVWKTLRWFWDHQASPGLYTWWEDKGEGNTFHLWDYVRGWINPPHVTPHYWTSAEMLLLQLDMLAYVDNSEDPPVLVIGAGIPSMWLDKTLRVEGVPTLYGKIDWIWKDRSMHVAIHGVQQKVAVRLGAAFSPDTPVDIEQEGVIR